MINIFNISKYFNSITALKNVSFEVKNGKIMGLLGENGAGKSTLLRILSTITMPSSGTAKINGFDILKNSKEVRKSIGVLFGTDSGLYDKLTARENLEFFANLNMVEKSKIKKRIEYLAEKFSFEEYIDRQIYTLSKGMKQKIAVARSIIHDPSVMLLDEPDAGLDFMAAKIVFDFIELCKKEGKSIIFSSHSMENIKNYSDKMAVLHKGKIVKTFDVHEYIQKYDYKEMNNLLFNLVCYGSENPNLKSNSKEGENNV